ncbi:MULTISPECIES: flagellar basal body-associated protein FliL [Vibrio]|uniref:Flagellar protein FliL n=1 Tax=Vibrio neptunius TaxID=170651 RepID=A0ABS3A8C1_9VIBR|nr:MULTISPECIES: flagellar basal body-associated protein FliL [Vibrio]MBN3491598.1 flagellar basal body-associated protein FliL [Vibrio neptunius]MBN3514221.1 flagellar basal body-associated protein FliL [Vibrio neptunius]MBN3551169.1 flagellar basal body-associated protein FliL [Vibrio neptunius]MBN3575009.1 flagellar basal body-associated protein FliL [Vibrio neptunius]MBN3579299.1 flagellar basal body-associated protein FliL [Vibrio neptunius]
MADEGIEAEAPKGKSKLLIIIIAVVVLLVGGGGAAFFLMGSDESEEAAQTAQQEVVVSTEPVSYVNIAQPFLFNVTGDKKDRLVQIKVQLMVRGTENENLARYHSPLVESSLLGTFASATVDQLRSVNGRVELRDKATEDIKASLTRAVGQPVIERVLFTDFVIQ